MPKNSRGVTPAKEVRKSCKRLGEPAPDMGRNTGRHGHSLSIRRFGGATVTYRVTDRGTIQGP